MIKLRKILESKETEIKARDYWDKYLEYNPLRKMSKQTEAGAFLAYKIENAGDILREFGKDYTDPFYVNEKIRKIKMTINFRDWTDKLSENEQKALNKTLEMIYKIPELSEIVKAIKQLLIHIAKRQNKKLSIDLKAIEYFVKKL